MELDSLCVLFSFRGRGCVWEGTEFLSVLMLEREKNELKNVIVCMYFFRYLYLEFNAQRPILGLRAGHRTLRLEAGLELCLG